jgi:hypothetical protein
MILENRIIVEGKLNRDNFQNVRPKRKRVGSFRIVSENDQKHVIEKKRKFFYWEWWSRSYLYNVNGCYVVDNKDTANRILKILTEDK